MSNSHIPAQKVDCMETPCADDTAYLCAVKSPIPNSFFIHVSVLHFPNLSFNSLLDCGSSHCFLDEHFCYVSITHVNSVSISVYHVTICQQTLFRDARQLPTILSSSLCSLRHSSEIPQATLESYLMSLLFGHHQWISTWTLYSSFQPST